MGKERWVFLIFTSGGAPCDGCKLVHAAMWTAQGHTVTGSRRLCPPCFAKESA